MSKSQKGKPRWNQEQKKYFSKMSSKSVNRYKNCTFVDNFSSIKQASQLTGIHRSTISRSCRNVRTNDKEYKWAFANDFEQIKQITQGIIKL